MPQGTIKKLVTDRGFGFIQGERDELFFHHSAVVGTAFDGLQEGQAVAYQVQPGSGGKGPRATEVKLV
ncbi:MAG: cold shock domain-containing protein [Pirellulales bacterium]|jgi:CspA family cold shock protein